MQDVRLVEIDDRVSIRMRGLDMNGLDRMAIEMKSEAVFEGDDGPGDLR